MSGRPVKPTTVGPVPYENTATPSEKFAAIIEANMPPPASQTPKREEAEVMSEELVERLRTSVTVADIVPAAAQAADQIEADGQRIAELEALCDRLKIEVQCHAMEARGANATINEINQAVSGATGEKGNWHGAGPAKSRIAALEAENDRRADLIGVLQGKLELAREALSNLLALGPDHDGWCQIGPIYNCTCDQFPARQAARAALEAMGIDHD